MIPTTIELEGTLQADGSLLLDAKPNLPPGRVHVILMSQEAAAEHFLASMKEMWANQKERGHVPRPKEEIDRELEAYREEWEEHQRVLEQTQEAAHKTRE